MKIRAIKTILYPKKSKGADDLSPSSTHTVDSFSGKKSLSAGSVRPRVKFAEGQNSFHENPFPDILDDCADIWYSIEQCRKMKEDNAYTCQMACRRTAASFSADSYTGVIQHVYDACCDLETESDSLPDQMQEDLEKQIQLWQTRVGLERQIIKSIAGKDKQLRRQRHVDLVQNLRRDCPSLSSADLAELMRLKSLEISRPARLFSQCIAKAQQTQ